MAFDGITMACVVQELNEKLLDGRVYKIAQPEKDEILLTIKAGGTQQRLSLNADASLPLIYLTQENKKSPMTAPNFCMLLRKHIQNGRIVKIDQPGLERVVRFEIEHLDEMGDLRRKTLAMELMGKHSNIIFYDEENKILDSIKHISGLVSSVREVLPGRTYFIPQTEHKKDALIDSVNKGNFLTDLKETSVAVYKGIYFRYTGVSPIVAQEICYRAVVDADLPTSVLDPAMEERLYQAFASYIDAVKLGIFEPAVYYDNGEPVEFGVLPFTLYEEKEKKVYDSISELLWSYYSEKSAVTRIRQKSTDLRKIVTTALERNVKKYDLQVKQLADTEKREKYKVYGELLHTYGYQIEAGAKKATVPNYYTGEEIEIPLDDQLTPMENAKKYFERYGKLKRTYEALTEYVQETGEEVEHLRSVVNALDLAQDEADLSQIREELVQSGYIRHKGNKKKEKIVSKPLHFISSDGFDMYVGKNNFQNEEITFQMAQGGDWWFHAKGMPGSHVIVKTNGKELPDRTFEEAGRLAAHYSSAKGQNSIEVDYVQRKHVKKPGGAKPGFVVYYTNYSMVIDPDISGLQKAD